MSLAPAQCLNTGGVWGWAMGAVTALDTKNFLSPAPYWLSRALYLQVALSKLNKLPDIINQCLKIKILTIFKIAWARDIAQW